MVVRFGSGHCWVGGAVVVAGGGVVMVGGGGCGWGRWWVVSACGRWWGRCGWWGECGWQGWVVGMDGSWV